jgi:hypothetical protein
MTRALAIAALLAAGPAWAQTSGSLTFANLGITTITLLDCDGHDPRIQLTYGVGFGCYAKKPDFPAFWQHPAGTDTTALPILTRSTSGGWCGMATGEAGQVLQMGRDNKPHWVYPADGSPSP